MEDVVMVDRVTKKGKDTQAESNTGETDTKVGFVTNPA